jgi:hypothetical protein
LPSTPTNLDANMTKFIPVFGERRGVKLQVQAYNALNRLHALCSAQSIMLAATSPPQKTSSYWLFIRNALAAVSGASYERRLCRRREQIGASQEHFCSPPSKCNAEINPAHSV